MKAARRSAPEMDPRCGVHSDRAEACIGPFLLGVPHADRRVADCGLQLLTFVSFVCQLGGQRCLSLINPWPSWRVPPMVRFPGSRVVCGKRRARKRRNHHVRNNRLARRSISRELMGRSGGCASVQSVRATCFKLRRRSSRSSTTRKSSVSSSSSRVSFSISCARSVATPFQPGPRGRRVAAVLGRLLRRRSYATRHRQALITISRADPADRYSRPCPRALRRRYPRRCWSRSPGPCHRPAKRSQSRSQRAASCLSPAVRSRSPEAPYGDTPVSPPVTGCREVGRQEARTGAPCRPSALNRRG